MIFLDTHVVLWLYRGDLTIFPPSVLERLESQELLMSPIALLELQYLYEIKRIKVHPRKIYDELKGKIGLSLASESLEDIILIGLDQSWTRDPFDRLIVSHAKLLNLKLVSKDKTILDHYQNAVWN